MTKEIDNLFEYIYKNQTEQIVFISRVPKNIDDDQIYLFSLNPQFSLSCIVMMFYYEYQYKFIFILLAVLTIYCKIRNYKRNV